MINRDDMLELTCRMNLSRNCFLRLAGAYMDAEGYEDDSFNTNFLNLKDTDKKKNLEIAKAVPFARTNEQLKEYRFPKNPEQRKKSMWQLLTAIKNADLKDDALLSIFYEVIGEHYKSNKDYAIYVFSGSYDVPTKGTDGAWMEGSEEVYDFIICSIAPLIDDYELGMPEFGFLYPAFSDRRSDNTCIDIYNIDPNNTQAELMNIILGE